jgi:hypothetical protein
MTTLVGHEEPHNPPAGTPAGRSSINPGIAPEAMALPTVEQHRGRAGQFVRDLLNAGHQRQSPGDPTPAGTSAATAGNKSRNPGQADPMTQVSPNPQPIAAADFARADGETIPGSAPSGVANGVRAAIPAEQYWSDLRGLPVGGNRGTSADPESNNDGTVGGQVENNDDNAPLRTNPKIDNSPSTGARKAMSFAAYEALKEQS